MGFEKLSAEEREKLASMSPEELHKLAQEEGHELSEKELEAISGGKVWYGPILPDMKAKCNKCGKTTLYNSEDGTPTKCSHCFEPYD
jgi:bacteriocin-like protein